MIAGSFNARPRVIEAVQEEIMPTTCQPSTLTLRRIVLSVTCAIVSLGFCTPAFSQTTFDWSGSDSTHPALVSPLGATAIENAVRRTSEARVGWNGGAHRRSASYRRLGRWSVFPGLVVGAMLGAAVSCLTTGCGPDTPNIPAGVFPGMFVGGAIAAYAPRRVAAGFLGVGAGMYAGGAVSRAIQGDCSPDHPCRSGVSAGAGAAVGGFLGYSLVSP